LNSDKNKTNKRNFEMSYSDLEASLSLQQINGWAEQLKWAKMNQWVSAEELHEARTGLKPKQAAQGQVGRLSIGSKIRPGNQTGFF
jgi:hypothetical protein